MSLRSCTQPLWLPEIITLFLIHMLQKKLMFVCIQIRLSFTYNGYSVKCFRVTRLLTNLTIGKGDGSYNKLMRDLIKPDLLILDDFGMKQMDLGMTQDFLEVIEERYHHKRALAISAQLPVKEWPSVFKDATIADAVLDRIVRNAYRFDLKGPSRRQTVEHMPADAGDDKSTQSEYTEN